MKDIDKLKKLLDEFGVEHSESEAKNGDRCITVMEGDEKVTGYSYFFTEFNFDDSGKFENIALWE